VPYTESRRRQLPCPEKLRSGKAECPRGIVSDGQLLELLSLLQIERIEAFGEPVVDRSEKLAGLIPLALIAPEPGEAPAIARASRSAARNGEDNNQSSRLQPRTSVNRSSRQGGIGRIECAYLITTPFRWFQVK
jgi:hypothetical protein